MGVDILYLGGIIMGYFNIIDSLKDVEVVNEDMKSMTKDKKIKMLKS